MTLHLIGIQFYEFYDHFDEKLDGLELTDTEKWMVNWLLKNTLLTTFIVCQFYNVFRYVNMDSLLKMTSVGIALTAAWIPCLKAYPLFYVLLILLQTFFITIGPLLTLPHLLRMLWNGSYRYPMKRMRIRRHTIAYISIPLHFDSPRKLHALQANIAIVLFAEFFWDGVMADFPIFDELQNQGIF